MKAAPVIEAIAGNDGVTQSLVHTGQHYDANMSRVFFTELGLPEPNANLEVGQGSHSYQTAEIMKRFEEWIGANPADLVLVYGDVNSTVAASLVCAKQYIRIGHVEAGLRSFDRSMPEEINRLVTDQIADLLFTPSEDGDENLRREGVPEERIHLVGNVMIDTLVRLLPTARAKKSRGAPSGAYGLVTMHRPSNVDDPVRLQAIQAALEKIGRELPLIFPVHPRTRAMLMTSEVSQGLEFVEPMGYLEFLSLQADATLVITDSGGIQEESTYLHVPCLTLRTTTERPVTVSQGTNKVVGDDPSKLFDEVIQILDNHERKGGIPPLWDGKASQRITQILFR
jgi:UDP-N-acetylglucosamine 2-epimerase (non-hydrolysing)